MTLWKRARHLVQQYLTWHQKQLKERPYVTNAATSCLLMLGGDRLAQRIEHNNAIKDGASHAGADQFADQRASWTRTGILTLWSTTVSSPFYTWWYRLLHAALPGRYVVWVAITAVIPAPAFNLAFFGFSTAAEHLLLCTDPLQPEAVEQMYAHLKEKVKKRWIQTVITSTQVWSIVNYINFRFVPVDNRMLVGSVFALGWSIYLSLQQHADAPPTHSRCGTTSIDDSEGRQSVAGPDMGPLAMDEHNKHGRTVSGGNDVSGELK